MLGIVISAMVEKSLMFYLNVWISVFLLNPRVPAEMHACANIQILKEDDDIISFLSSYTFRYLINASYNKFHVLQCQAQIEI